MTSPSNGEWAAISGYSAQYIIAAGVIYEHIIRGSLDWVKLVDPEAGRVDDFVIGSAGCVDAYQVKWASSKGTYTFLGLTRPSEGKPSIWRQLADGWKVLTQAHPNLAVRVHFLTNEIASANTPIPAAVDENINFQQFWVDVFRPYDGARRSSNALPAKYQIAIAELRAESALTASEFESFFLQCDISFDRSDPRRSEGVAPRESPALDDLRKLAGYLQHRVASGTPPVTISRDSLLADLHWAQRLTQHFHHHFALDLTTYRPIEPTTKEILSAIADRRFGYVALLGGPGSGKSTALTHTLRYANGVRVITYYAYLNSDSTLGRGEAASFWRDIFVAIREQGVRPNGPLPRSGEEFRTAVIDQLRKLSADWSSREVVTVLLVDGLDHIQREQRPSESLIRQLPLPEQLPEGVIVFLGSQTLALDDLSPSIATHLALPGRTLTMRRLSRTAVASMAKRVLQEDSPVSVADVDLLFERGEGHPLSTIYLLGELGRATSSDDVRHILDAARRFGSDVELRYETYWRALSDEATKRLLALLARIRVPVNLLEALSWVAGLDVPRFLFNAKHFFHELEQRRWTFFHNSFRQFLLRKTSENVLGQFDTDIDKGHHVVLAELCAKSNSQSLRREALFHDFMAEKYRSVIELGTQHHFRRQFFELRHPHQIFEDIGFVLRAASHELDGLAVVRAWLIESELREREQALDDASFRVSLDTFLGDEQLIDAISSPGQLFVDRTDALRAAARLFAKGQVARARALFDLAEPLDLLTGVRSAPGRHDHETDDLLSSWLAVAIEFRDVNEILAAISSVKADAIQELEESRTQELRMSLLTTLGVDCWAMGSEAWDSYRANAVVLALGDQLIDAIEWRAAAIGSPEIRVEALQRLIARTDVSQLDPERRIYLADLIRRSGYEPASIEVLLEGAVQPSLIDTRDFSTELRIETFSHRILLNRLLAFLGRPESPEEAVPWPSDTSLHVLARLERCLVSIANLWGAGLRGDVRSGPELVQHLHQALRFYYQDRSDVHFGWYRYTALAVKFFETMVRATAPHGADALAALGNEFDRLWREKDRRAYWPIDVKLSIAVALFQHGGSSEALGQRINGVDDQSDREHELQDRLRILLDLARAWRMAGDEAQTAKCLDRMLEGSFGIYHDKDRQFQSWVEWLDRAVRNGGALLSDEVPMFAAALASIVKGHRGRGTHEAAQHLVATCYRESPAFGMALSDRLVNDGAIQYAHAANGLLTGLLDRSDANFSAICQYLVHLGVALTLPDAEDLARSLVATASSQWSAEAPVALMRLINAIRTHEFGSGRAAWYSGLTEGLRLSVAPPSQIASLINELRASSVDATVSAEAPDGTTESESKVISSVHDFESLIDAMQLVDRDSAYSLDRVAKPFIEAANLEQLDRLRMVLSGTSRMRSRLCIEITKRYLALNVEAVALALASELFAEAPAIGWIEWFDGGTKIKPALQLIGIDPSKSRAAVFDAMVADYLAEIRNSRDFVASLDDLTPILFTTIPWRDLWVEIREHAAQLMEFRAEPLTISAAQEISGEQALLHSVVKLFALTVPELELRCARCLSALGDGSPAMQAAVIAALSDSGLPHWKVAAVIYLSDSQGWGERLHKLVGDSDFSVRVIARKLSDGLENPDVLRQPSDWLDAPMALRIKLSALESEEPSLPFSAIRAGDPLPKPRTPLDLFHIWLPELRMLAIEADLPLENLLERGWQLAAGVIQRMGISDEADRELRDFLSAVDLQIGYRRPWSEISALALQELCSELVDYGRVRPTAVMSYGIHNVFDEILMRTRVAPRPAGWIRELAKTHMDSRDNWLANVGNVASDLAFQRAASDGLVVIAEFSRFVAHDWEISTETRTAFLSSAAVSEVRALPSKDTDWFPNVGPRTTEGYLLRATGDKELFVGGSAYRLRCGPTKWLAVAPNFARRLRLSPGEQPFTWVNSDGQLCAWSVYWRDGPGRRQPPHFERKFGSGWLVLMRREALVAADLRNFRLHRCCVRQSHGTHGRSDEDRTSTDAIPVSI